MRRSCCLRCQDRFVATLPCDITGTFLTLSNECPGFCVILYIRDTIAGVLLLLWMTSTDVCLTDSLVGWPDAMKELHDWVVDHEWDTHVHADATKSRHRAFVEPARLADWTGTNCRRHCVHIELYLNPLCPEFQYANSD